MAGSDAVWSARRASQLSLSPGQLVEVTIEKAVYQGLGLARHAGQVVFVRRGVPGERVQARVVSVARGYVRAEIVALLAVSPERRDSPCALFATCGGCAYQDVAYPAQLNLKAAILRESLSRAGVVWEGAVAVRPSPEEGWRTRATLHVGQDRNGVRLGFHQEGTHEVVDVERCLHLSEVATSVVAAVRLALDRQPRLARALRRVEIAEGMAGGALVLSFETDLGLREAAALAALSEGLDQATGVGVFSAQPDPMRRSSEPASGRRRAAGPRSRNSAGADARRPFALLRGSPYVHATVLETSFRIHARSFFQANRFLVEELVRAVSAKVPAGGTVLDLYAGVGLFALALARRVERVLGAELNPTAVADALANCAGAGIQNARFERADVRAALSAWPVERGERIVLDPPRTGAGPEVVRAVAGRHPESIIYVSCHPPTLGRDLKLFADQGYRLNSLQAFDMFPDTFHLETLAELHPA